MHTYLVDCMYFLYHNQVERHNFLLILIHFLYLTNELGLLKILQKLCTPYQIPIMLLQKNKCEVASHPQKTKSSKYVTKTNILNGCHHKKVTNIVNGDMCQARCLNVTTAMMQVCTMDPLLHWLYPLTLVMDHGNLFLYGY